MTSLSRRKRLGCCSLCDAEVFEIETRFPNRDPKTIGLPLENAERATVLLMDGSTLDATVCSGCDMNFDLLWNNVLEAFVFEQKTRTISAELAEIQQRNLEILARNIPLGVLRRQPWSELWPS